MDNEKKEINKVPELIQVKSPVSFVKLTGNGAFCNSFLAKKSMTVLPTDSSEENYRAESLIYTSPQSSDFDSEAFATIIDLLNQLKAATNDQNVFVQNNTVVREQILRQLKNEVLRAHTNLTTKQIKNLEVISSNNFDEQTLTDILKSLLEDSKKKYDSEGHLVYRTQDESKSQKTATERVAEDYLKILKNVHHYSKMVEDVFNHVSSKKTIHNLANGEKSETKPTSEQVTKTQKSTKQIQNISKELRDILDTKVLQEIQESFEKKIINKIGVLSPIVKLQSKISELSVITNVSKIVGEVVKRTVPRVLKTNTKLINKIVDRSEIEELKENILSHQEQYQVDKAVHKRSLDRMYNDIRKVYNTKNIYQNVFEVLKSSKFKNVNFEEAIKKNLLKVTSKNEVVNRIRNIYEKEVQKSNARRVIDKTEMVNRENVEVLDEEERLAIDDIVNLKRSNRNVEQHFSHRTNLADRIFENVNTRNINYKTLFHSIDTMTNNTHEQKEILKRILISHFIGAEDGEISHKTEKIDKFIKKYNRLVFANKEYRITENGYEFNPVYLKERVINNQEIENVVAENVKKVLSPVVLTDNISKITQKDIYRKIVTPIIKKHIKTTETHGSTYLIHRDASGGAERILDYVDRPYMVYKEEPTLEQIRAVSESKKSSTGKSKIGKDETPHIEQVVQPEVIDTKKIEKEIISKTLKKDEVEDMINSRMKKINIDVISREVMGRVENKLRMDKRRRGVF